MLSRILLALVCCCCSLSWALAREPIRLPLRHVKAQIRERFLTPDSYYDYVAASSDDTSTVLAGSSVTPLKFNLADSSYRLDIALGVPPQQFSVILNTEDGAFWVTDSTCNDTSDWSPCDDCGFGPMCIRTCTASCCGGKSTLWRETAEKLSRRNPATLDTEDPLCGAGTRKFNSKLSTTYTKTTKTYSNVDTIYDGYMAGKVGEDVLSIGSLKIPALFFGQTTSLTEYELFYDNFTIEGVLGVGYSAVTLPNTLPPLYLAYNDGLLEIPVFSLYLSAGSGGEVTFGGFPSPSLCASNAIDWHDTKGAARYDVTVQSATYVSTTDAKGGLAIFASTSGRLGLPDKIATAVASSVDADFSQESGTYYYDCNKKVGNVTLTVDGIQYTVPGDRLRGTLSGGNGCYLRVWNTAYNFGLHPYIFGEPFLEAYCTIYDFGKQAVGIARHAL